MDTIERMFQHILPTLQGGMDVVAATTQQNTDQSEANRQNAIAVNIDRAQQTYGIPDDKAVDFETWIQIMASLSTTFWIRTTPRNTWKPLTGI
tara:strand:- start:19 stop:297 length:279 start_codon:yes stop_codon:yes gene_type:complete